MLALAARPLTVASQESGSQPSRVVAPDPADLTTSKMWNA